MYSFSYNTTTSRTDGRTDGNNGRMLKMFYRMLTRDTNDFYFLQAEAADDT